MSGIASAVSKAEFYWDELYSSSPACGGGREWILPCATVLPLLSPLLAATTTPAAAGAFVLEIGAGSSSLSLRLALAHPSARVVN